MQPVTNYTVLQDDASLINCLQPVFNDSYQISQLDSQWVQVKLDDIAAFEALHTLLYPLLFKYVYFLVDDIGVADTVTEDVFINFWRHKATMADGNIKVAFVNSTRQHVLAYLSGIGCSKWQSAVSVLTILNSTGFSQREGMFLNKTLKLAASDIEEIITS